MNSISCVRSLCAAACLLSAGCMAARADVVGRVRFRLDRVQAGGKSVRATILLEDSAGIRPGVIVTTDRRGEALTPLLENRDWIVQSIQLSPDPDPASKLKEPTVPFQQRGASERPSSQDLDSARGQAHPRGEHPPNTPPLYRAFTVRVAADTVTEVTLVVDGRTGLVVDVRGMFGAVNLRQTADLFDRDADFIHRYPLNAGNPQRLGPILRSVPFRP